ncbi:unnamed protein product [Aspergillus oryzae var. brunneus]|uniref:Unnamed protein product n=2 Tax=Aspergillus oryzae TaxID=5062 RepID=A0A1S9D7Q6_ASPOZ|nr:hypothetical protein OAory_01112730 [Aspergillus oryzae]GMG14900.1 unnamed protein product [Aspergillus oryzae]GMG28015.1 unnamed protein product [Aspergillus oryzae]GMG48218.1 unnamed protein product [Aspergillus oryzae var. brunneus]
MRADISAVLTILVTSTLALAAPTTPETSGHTQDLQRRQNNALLNAVGLEDHSKYADNSGGLFSNLASNAMIIGDHIKYTVDPPSAEEPLPKGQDSPAREAHRKAHVAINKGLGAS